MPRWPERPDYEVDPNTGCWIWLKAKKPSGYGNLRKDGEWWIAHRYYYTVHKGEIPDGMVIDHLYKNSSCVNPDHLEPVTQAENLERGDGRWDNFKIHYERLESDPEYRQRYGDALRRGRG